MGDLLFRIILLYMDAVRWDHYRPDKKVPQSKIF